MKKILSTIGVVSGCLIFSAVHSQVKAQARTITGQVNDGEKPIRGATVTQQGTTQMTTTSSTGTFILQITGENPILIFRHPEYAEQKISTDGKTTFRISLTEKVKSIEEVVLNAGYYNVKVKESTGSISKVTAKDIENQPVGNVLSAIQGRMAGVSIVQNSGVAGGGYSIQIRGRNSLRTYANSEIDGSQPLYIVDGIPMGGGIMSKYGSAAISEPTINPLNSINPNDIESVEILKDADATSIYGSRGANGVVLVTTKKGKEGRLSITWNQSHSRSTILSSLEMMNTEDYLKMRKQAFLNDGITNYPSNAYDINGTWSKTNSTNWIKELLGNTAITTSTQLSLSGGTSRSSYLLSFGHNEQTTVFSDDFYYKTNSLSGNYSHQSSDGKFNLRVSNVYSLIKNNVVNQDITMNATILPPNAPNVYNEDGSINWANNTFDNPVAIYNSVYKNDNIQFLNSINAQYEILKNLKIKLNAGANYTTFKEQSLIPHTVNKPSTGQTSMNSKAYQYNNDKMSYILEPQLQWETNTDKHQFGFLLGGTYQSDYATQGVIQGNGFTNNSFIHNIGAAQTKIIGDQITTGYKYLAGFIRLNYQYNHQYILNITGRRDGSSRFGPDNKFANFGAIGGAWIFSRSKLLAKLQWLSFGKLRMSYGTSGSDNIGDYQYLDTYTTTNLGYDNNVGLAPSRLFNPNYSWEKTTKTEAALDLEFFKKRLGIVLAWYRNESSNQLVGYQLPSITGYSSVLANLDATIENTGLEFELSGQPLVRQLKWQSSVNFSIPKNKLLSFPGLSGSTYANTYVIGQPVTILKLYHMEGINPANGQYIFTDFDKDGKISVPNDRQSIRDVGVKFFGGWSNQLNYKNWQLSFLLQFVKQNSRNFNYLISSPGMMGNLPVELNDVWALENPNGKYMPYSTKVNTLHSMFKISDGTVSDGSYIRFKNLQLSYNIPITDKIVRSARIYFQGQNLITWTRYFGMDPEFSSSGFLPNQKTYSFGFQLNF